MTKFLIQKFIKNPDDINNLKVRRNYGTLSSVVGIICNVFLFILKYIMGTLSGSISVVSDAFNNLSDSAGCMVTLLGYKLASKPADKDHPFGHGRMEYLTALTIAVLILIVAFELFRNSVNKIIHPGKADIQSDCINFAVSIYSYKALDVVFQRFSWKENQFFRYACNCQGQQNRRYSHLGNLYCSYIVFVYKSSRRRNYGIGCIAVYIQVGY